MADMRRADASLLDRFDYVAATPATLNDLVDEYVAAQVERFRDDLAIDLDYGNLDPAARVDLDVNRGPLVTAYERLMRSRCRYLPLVIGPDADDGPRLAVTIAEDLDGHGIHLTEVTATGEHPVATVAYDPDRIRKVDVTVFADETSPTVIEDVTRHDDR